MLGSAAVLAAGARAGAQAPADRFALDTFHPAPAGDRFFGLQSPESLGHGAIDVSLVTDIALHPLVLSKEAPGAAPELVPVVRAQLFEHVGLAVTLWDRWKASVDMPLGVSHMEADPELPTGEQRGHAVAGDLRVGLRLFALGEQDTPLRLALAGSVWLPTGEEARFAGEGRARGGPELVLGGGAGRWTWGASTGAVLRPRSRFFDAELGSQLTLGLGAAARVAGIVQVLVETRGAVVVSGPGSFSEATNNLEVSVGWRFRVGPVVVAAAPGGGVLRGAGTPFARILFGLQYAPLTRTDLRVTPPDRPPDPPPPPLADGDRDGVPDELDACREAAGPPSGDPRAHGCPDRDGDAIIDRIDACPGRAGAPDDSLRRHGCPPPDADGDGILDRDDVCPERRGPRSGEAGRSGCPGDRDFDAVLDDEDACPDVKGGLSLEPSRNGCPPP